MRHLCKTSQELEYLLSRKIEDLYQNKLNLQLNKINYQIFEKTLVVIIEGTVTQVEHLLKERDRRELASQVRKVIDNELDDEIKKLIEDVMDINVVDFLSDTSIDSSRTGVITIFEFKRKSCSNES